MGAASIDNPQRRALARRYARQRRWLFLADVALSALALLVFTFGGLAVWWRDALVRFVPGGAGGALLLVVYVASLLVAGAVLTLPLSYYGSLVVPRRYRLSVQTRRGWLGDYAKATLLGLVQALLVAGIVVILLRLAPQWWWLVAGLLLTLLGVLLAHLAPLLIVPLFFRLTPLPDEVLRQRLQALAARAGTRVERVEVMDLSRRTRTANAAMMGLGGTRRIVLGDTLVDAFTADEVVAVLAHELGHHVNRDLWRGLALDGALTLVALWLANVLGHALAGPLGLDGLTDIAALPLLLLIGGGLFLIVLPVTNGFSRRREAAADAFAVRATEDPAAWQRALRRLAEMNLAEVDPPPWVEWLLYSHPSIGKRIAAADPLHRPGQSGYDQVVDHEVGGHEVGGHEVGDDEVGDDEVGDDEVGLRAGGKEDQRATL